MIYLCKDVICISTVDARENNDMTSSKVTPLKVIVGRILPQNDFFRNQMSNLWQYSSWKDAMRKEKERSFKQLEISKFSGMFHIPAKCFRGTNILGHTLERLKSYTFWTRQSLCSIKIHVFNPKVGPKTSCLCKVLFYSSMYRGEINPSETHWFVFCWCFTPPFLCCWF